ncbi:MAG TPA: hypothetical protein PKA28_06085 [Methylomusa anaerophila]|uniref:Uncharacterized protein n=1 Tax=Methylomusa anaerophila TaxID=1930071 RepID=A0A348ALN7_9FIRM|nr:hypothetical protein [Methylomusa anaerophila]BBB91985.1 hypothetical protein MAMMFC1_02670 [Methylomusa anaerophila]HML88002.1 hypothetical protein [Methylomusa anaerophila]
MEITQAQLIKYAKMARAAYIDGSQKCIDELSAQGYYQKDVIDNPDNGGYARIFESNTEVIVAFQGTEQLIDTGDWWTRGENQYSGMHI